jgi:hypothetical protein
MFQVDVPCGLVYKDSPTIELLILLSLPWCEAIFREPQNAPQTQHYRAWRLYLRPCFISAALLLG